MMKKITLSFFIVLVAFIWYLEPTFAHSKFMWSTGVDVPFTYSRKISSGDHGIILKGSQLVFSKKHSVTYQLVKKGMWSDKIFDSAKIRGSYTNEESFQVKLNAPPGEDYQIKIDGFGSGNLSVQPY